MKKWSILVLGLVACNGEIETQLEPDMPAEDTGSYVDMESTEDMSEPEADADPFDMPLDLLPDTSETRKWSRGCGLFEGLAEGEHTFELDGRTRRYIVRLPQNYVSDEGWPLVFALHGNGGSAAFWDVTSGNRNIREVLKDEAVLVIAEAIEGNWRDYNAPQDTWPDRIESELRYFDEVLEQVKLGLCIDTDEVFTMGFSGGGSFSGVLTCRRDDYRAMAVGGSVMYFEPQDCTRATPAWITIGTEELVPGREAFRDFFRDQAGCSETSTPVDPAPCVAYETCDVGTPVHYCQHAGDHVWPDIGSQAMWEFFKQFVD